MADQARWFKLWCSAPSDDTIQSLSPALRWAWAAFGAYTKLHGTRGQIVVSPSNAVLAAEMGVTPDALRTTIQRLPHVHIEEGQNRHGGFTVTWNNWVKYQEDSTQAQRQRASRSKRRREENKNKTRTEEKRITTTTLSGGPPDGGVAWADARWPSPEALAHLYNTATPDNVPAVRSLSAKRREKATKMLRQFPERAWWEEAFKHYHRSRFLSGRAPASPGHEGFQPDFDWLLANGKNGTENAVKVHDGNYQ